MKYARYLESGRPRIGMADAEKATLRPLEDRTGNLIDLINEHPDGPKTTQKGGQPIALDRVNLMAPIIPPRNIFCVGKNYRIHAKECSGSGFEAGAVKRHEIDEYPAVFTEPRASRGRGRIACAHHLFSGL